MPKLYPPAKPYKKGFLKVGDGYELYYELCGNPKGKPVLFLHGGPGAGFRPKDKRFFNPSVYNAVFFDQRGAGRSKPFASTKNNTTWKLVQDIRILLKYLGLKKVFLFGGSWGSTLALVYAIKYPGTVTGMLLRGIFLSNKKDNEEFFLGTTPNYFPEAWERFVGFIPKRERKSWKSIIRFYMERMKSKDRKARDKHAYEWARYEPAVLELDRTEKGIKKSLKGKWWKSLAPLEAHYIGNLCFLPDNYILKNARKLSKIPTVIVHGRYDMVCRPVDAYRLHKAIKKSKLYFVISGHGSHDKKLESKLVDEMNKFRKYL